MLLSTLSFSIRDRATLTILWCGKTQTTSDGSKIKPQSCLVASTAEQPGVKKLVTNPSATWCTSEANLNTVGGA